MDVDFMIDQDFLCPFSQGTAGTFNDLTLTIVDFNTDLEGTYVCRTSNIAGEDADIVSLVTSE